MKVLYYNLIEVPQKIRLKSTALNVDIEYDPMYCNETELLQIDYIYQQKKYLNSLVNSAYFFVANYKLNKQNYYIQKQMTY